MEAADGTDFMDVDSWTDVSGSLGTEGDTSTLDDTIQPGQEIVVHEEVLVTGDERDALMATGGAGQFGSGGGGLLDQIFSIPGMIVGGLAGWLGLRSGRD
jgi:hypothetical protein